MTNKELQRLTKFWQKVLRLQDWELEVRITRGRDMADDGHQGECHYIQSLKQAKILIVDPIDYPSEAWEPQDIERTLCHELLHLHFAPFYSEKSEDDPERTAQEQAIEILARAYVNLKRGERLERKVKDAKRKDEGKRDEEDARH